MFAVGFTFLGGTHHVFQQVSWLSDQRADSAFSCHRTQWRMAVTLPDHSDRIAQDFHLIPSFRTAGVYVDATGTALKNTQSIVV